jgi:hypothetical protein
MSRLKVYPVRLVAHVSATALVEAETPYEASRMAHYLSLPRLREMSVLFVDRVTVEESIGNAPEQLRLPFDEPAGVD